MEEGGKEGRSSSVTQCLCQLQCSSSTQQLSAEAKPVRGGRCRCTQVLLQIKQKEILLELKSMHFWKQLHNRMQE